jgi:hypothetical protein
VKPEVRREGGAGRKQALNSSAVNHLLPEPDFTGQRIGFCPHDALPFSHQLEGANILGKLDQRALRLITSII